MNLGNLIRQVRRQGRTVFRPLRPPATGSPDAAKVELLYWRPAAGDNFGDYLSHVVTTKILADSGYFIGEGAERPHRLLAIGSILHLARDCDHVWGSGVNGKIAADRYRFTRLNVHAVRGPRTRQFLQRLNIPAPEVYGDPALLLPHLLPGRFTATGELPFVVVPNLHDLPLVRDLPNVISPLQPWNICVEQILRGRLVIASSLHGLVIAEAYGLPARLLRLSERENLLKFEDYALGTGRSTIDYATSVEEAMEMGGMPPIQFDADRLLRVFPLSLWRSSAAPSTGTVSIAQAPEVPFAASMGTPVAR